MRDAIGEFVNARLPVREYVSERYPASEYEDGYFKKKIAEVEKRVQIAGSLVLDEVKIDT